MHPAWLAPWEHGVPCTDYGNLLERCTAAYERFDASESVPNGRPAEKDGKDDEQSAEGDGEDDEQSAEGDGEDDEQSAEGDGEDDEQSAEGDGEDDEEDVELSLFDVLGYQYQPRVAMTLTNPRLHYGVPIPGPGTAWLAPRRFSHVFNRNLMMNDDSRPHHQYIIRQSLTSRRVDTHD